MVERDGLFLTPLVAISPDQMPAVGRAVAGQAIQGQAELVPRGFDGAARRLASPEEATEALLSARADDLRGISDTFVIERDAVGAVGMATLYHALKLQRYRIPLRVEVLGTEEKGLGPNISAWTTENANTLQIVYGELAIRAADSTEKPAWTTEPTTSSKAIHNAIGASGLSEVNSGWYNDGDSGLVVRRRKFYKQLAPGAK
jgi:hypothetical protein